MGTDRVDINLKRRSPHGANCIVVNGQPVNARRIVIEASADKLTTVLMEQVAEISGTIEADVRRLMSAERPTEPGWYWCSHPSRFNGRAMPCLVFKHPQGDLLYSTGYDDFQVDDGFEMCEADEEWRWAPLLEKPPVREA